MKFLPIFFLLLIVSCKQNKFSKIDYGNKECRNEIANAKSDIRNGKFAYCDIIGMMPNYEHIRHKAEFETLLKENKIEFKSTIHSDVIGEIMPLNCYCEIVNENINEKFGENFIDSLHYVADSLWKEKQILPDKDLEIVLIEKKVGKEFVFGNWNPATGDVETRIKYLGEVIVSSNEHYKIINSIFIWGLSKRASSKILIFNNENKYIGYYYVSTILDLPSELRNGVLIFKNSESTSCDKDLVTKIDFKQGIPNQIFKKCKRDEGDIYTFERE